MRSFLALTLFVVLNLGIFPIAARAVDFGGVAARPANPTPGDERTSSWFVYALAAGAKKNNSLVIENNTDEQQVLNLYPADSTPTTGSGFALKQQVEKMNSVGNWIKLERSALTLAPHSQEIVNFSVAVPKDQPLGLWTGGIMVAAAAKQQAKAGINLNVRLGVRMYATTVPAVAPKPISIVPISAAVVAVAATLAAAIIIKRKALLKR